MKQFPKFVDLHDVIEILITTLDARDPYTYGHSWRVAEISVLIAKNMNISSHEIETIHLAAHLHDIGKIGVSDVILHKSGDLTREEFLLMQRHPVIGYNIVKRIRMFEHISEVILHHHERFDGLGYPEGLKGEDIPLGSRIIAVADGFDAITSDRPYRRKLSMKKAFSEINRHPGEQYDPLIVKRFNEILSSVPGTVSKVGRAKIVHYAHAILRSRKV